MKRARADFEWTTAPVRRAELRSMVGHLQRRGPAAPVLVDLSGEPGAGKTFLLGELIAEARGRGFPVLSARCVEQRADTPYAPFLDALSAAEDVLDRDTAELVRDVVDRVERAERPERMARPLAQAVQRLVRDDSRRGLLLVLDDVHWADDASIDLLTKLSLRSTTQAPLVVVLAHRPRPLPTRLRGFLTEQHEFGSAHRVELGPLSRRAAAELLGLAERDPVLRALHEESRGNPLYLRALAEARSTRPQDWTETAFGARVLVEAAPLDQDAVTVTEAAAVLDEGFDVDLLAEVAQLDRAATCTAAGELLRRDILRRTAQSKELAFRHPLVGWVLHAHADPCRRTAAHRRAAEARGRRGAPAVALARHVEHAADDPRPDDVPLLVEAANDALPTNPEAATRWLAAALRLHGRAPHPGVTRLDLLVDLARASFAAGLIGEGRALVPEIRALAATAPPERHAAAVVYCGLVEASFGNRAGARDLVNAALEQCPADRTAEVTALLLGRGVVDVLNGDLPSVHDVEALLRSTEGGPALPRAGALALRGLRQTWRCETTANTTATLAECAVIVDALPDAELVAEPQVLAVLAWAEAILGKLPDAERHFDRGLRLARRAGHNHLLPVLLLGRCHAYQDLGRFTDAHRAVTEAAAVLEHTAHDAHRGLAFALEARITTMTEKATRYRPDMVNEQAVEALRPRDSHWARLAALALSDAAMLFGDPELCAALILRAGGGFDLSELPSVLRSSCYETLTATSIHAGVPSEEWADSVEASAREEVLPQQRAYALMAQGHVARSHRDARSAAELYRQAAELFSAARMTAAQVRVLLIAGACAVEAGLVEDASALINRTKQLARESGATRIYDEADYTDRRLAKLKIGGVPLPRGSLSVLTDREREVAGMIATTGMRTREVADQLGLSPRTVDVHLSRIYRKLNISSRAALAALAAAQGLVPVARESGSR